MPPNFVLLDATLPDVTRLVAAMLQAGAAVEHRSWSHAQEPTGEEWWADVLADPRARKRERRTDLTVKRAAACLQPRSLSANGLRRQNSAGFPQICAIFQRDNLRRHF